MILAILELCGTGTLFYGLATVAAFFVSGQLSGLLDQSRIQRMIDSHSDHFEMARLALSPTVAS